MLLFFKIGATQLEETEKEKIVNLNTHNALGLIKLSMSRATKMLHVVFTKALEVSKLFADK